MKKVPQLKINIYNQSEDEAVIDIDGEIGGIDWEELKIVNTPKQIKDQLKKISALEVKKIIVNINSLGGFVDDGLAIHDILAQHEAEIETNVTGMTASAATIIAQAGDVRRISDNAMYLIHKGWGLAIGNSNDLEVVLQDLKKIDQRLANIYAKRSDKDVKDFEKLMNENNGDGKWLDADEAKEFGLVDEVFEPMKVAASVTKDQLKNYGLPVPKEMPEQETSTDTWVDLKNSNDGSYVVLDGGTFEEPERDEPEKPKYNKIELKRKKLNLTKNYIL